MTRCWYCRKTEELGDAIIQQETLHAMKLIGRCTYRNGKFYFDAETWSRLAIIARRRHISVNKLVNVALRRLLRNSYEASA